MKQTNKQKTFVANGTTVWALLLTFLNLEVMVDAQKVWYVF